MVVEITVLVMMVLKLLVIVCASGTSSDGSDGMGMPVMLVLKLLIIFCVWHMQGCCCLLVTMAML